MGDWKTITKTSERNFCKVWYFFYKTISVLDVLTTFCVNIFNFLFLPFTLYLQVSHWTQSQILKIYFISLFIYHWPKHLLKVGVAIASRFNNSSSNCERSFIQQDSWTFVVKKMQSMQLSLNFKCNLTSCWLTRLINIIN